MGVKPLLLHSCAQAPFVTSLLVTRHQNFKGLPGASSESSWQGGDAGNVQILPQKFISQAG